MIKHVDGDLIYFTFQIFDRTGMIRHCFSSRKGGISKGACESLNLRFKYDDRENVIKNYQILCKSIGMDYNNIVFSNQVHEDNIYYASENDRGKGLLKESDIENADGLITDRKNVILTAFYADCTPVFLFDPVNRVISLIHSGWRGTVRQIAGKAVKLMENRFNCSIKNILAGIGPCIGRCCFQVDEPVVKEFLDNVPFSEAFIFKEKENNKYKIDLEQVNRQILINCGLKSENIETAGMCTMCNSDILFSHRVMGDLRGSLAALMELF